MGIVVRGNYVIAAGAVRAFSSPGPAIDMEGDTQPTYTVTNKGSLKVSWTGSAFGVVDNTFGYGDVAAFFHNAKSGVLSVTSTANQAIGFETGPHSVGLTNEGAIITTALQGLGYGVYGLGEWQDGDFKFLNNGSVQTSAWLAWGVELNHSEFNNRGSIVAKGYSTLAYQTGAIGAEIYAPRGPVVNSGTITAQNVAHGAHSVGLIIGLGATIELDNSGKISGDVAVKAAPGDSSNITINNTGLLSGGIDLSANSGVESINNAGRITGDVHLNQQNTAGGAYDGSGGEVSGTVFGTKGADLLTGGKLSDNLSGGSGDDRLVGGEGQDSLTGGLGSDTFAFATAKESSVAHPDRITDFTSGEDRIDLSAIDPDSKTAGDQAFHWATSGGHAGDLVVHDDTVHHRTVIDLYVDNDNKADAEIWVDGDHTLSAADFIL